jgi:large subunit ribosomal protein L30
MAKAGNKIKIQLIKSPFGYKDDQIGTVKALGLRRMYQIKEINDTPSVRGMIFKVKHLVKII